MSNTHQVVDFGPGPEDHTLGYPFEGTEELCGRWIEANLVNGVREDRYAIQEIPQDQE